MRSAVLLVSLLFAAPLLRADRAADLVRIHVGAMGGAERIAALKSVRATGRVEAGGKSVRFTLVAARPDRVRVETEQGARRLVQATNGIDAPWELDTAAKRARARPMAPGAAKTFVADAEFDDPLVAGAARGYTVDYAGEVTADGRKLVRLLVTHRLTETFSVLLDSTTYLLVMRVEQKSGGTGRKVQVVTHYGDYRPVEGVLFPHEITLEVDGRVTQRTRIDGVEGNVAVAPEAFDRPPLAVAGLEKP